MHCSILWMGCLKGFLEVGSILVFNSRVLMSVTYHIKKEGLIENVAIPGFEISGHILVKLIADKLRLREQDILVTNPITGLKLADQETIKDKYSVNVEKVSRSDLSLSPGIVSNEQLAEMGAKARFFMIKSSN